MAYFNPDHVDRFPRIDSPGLQPRYILQLSLPFVAIATLLVLPLAAQADCQQQLQQLSTDLHGVALSETQKQTIGGMVDDARRYCWVHREEPAMEIIAKARQTAGIKPPGEEFDWETVPLESLERR